MWRLLFRTKTRTGEASGHICLFSRVFVDDATRLSISVSVRYVLGSFRWLGGGREWGGLSAGGCDAELSSQL